MQLQATLQLIGIGNHLPTCESSAVAGCPAKGGPLGTRLQKQLGNITDSPSDRKVLC